MNFPRYFYQAFKRNLEQQMRNAALFRSWLTVTDLDKLEIIAFDLKQDVRDIDKAWTR